eukprot:s129_g18.t1
MSGRQPKGARQQGHTDPDNRVGKLLAIHDVTLEKMKSALVVFLFVPKPFNDSVEAAAAAWKENNIPGKPHPEGCSCTTTRLKAMVNGISDAPTAKVLAAPDEAVAAMNKIVEIINQGDADSTQSPYEITLSASNEGKAFRPALQAITQPGTSGENTRDNLEKRYDYEFRPYRPQRRGAAQGAPEVSGMRGWATQRLAQPPQSCRWLMHRLGSNWQSVCLNFQKSSETVSFYFFLLPNMLRATTACNFSYLICPTLSAPTALASLLPDPPEPQNIAKTQCFATFLPFCAPASSLF